MKGISLMINIMEKESLKLMGNVNIKELLETGYSKGKEGSCLTMEKSTLGSSKEEKRMDKEYLKFLLKTTQEQLLINLC